MFWTSTKTPSMSLDQRSAMVRPNGWQLPAFAPVAMDSLWLLAGVDMPSGISTGVLVGEGGVGAGEGMAPTEESGPS